MRVSCICCLMGVLLFAGNAHATNASSYASSWGAAMAKCPKHNFTSSNGCLSNCSGASNGKNMMVARDVNSNGAKFCLTYVNSIRNNSAQQPWTEYHQAVGAGDCVWLCKPGWTGDECKTSTSGGTSSSTCDSITIKSSSYTGKADACTKPKNKNISCSTSNVESTISFLATSAKYDCSSNPFGGKERTANYKMEHDVILGITGWTSSGHGAFAQPIVVWAWCPKGKNDENCKLAVAPQKSKELLCKDGYKPNSSKSDCEAINGYVCQGIKDCSGWSASRFQGGTYKTVVVSGDSGSCTQYRCATANYGFAGDPKSNNSCIACTGGFKKVSETNGQCIEDTAAKAKAEAEAKAKAEAEAKAAAEAAAKAQAEAEAAAKAAAEAAAKAAAEADAKAKAEAEAAAKAAEEAAARAEAEARAKAEADAAAKAAAEAAAEAQAEADAVTNSDTSETIDYSETQVSTTVEEFSEPQMKYVVSKAEMRICWLKNGSPKEFKECVYNIMGGRVDAPAASQGVSAANSVTYVAPTPEPAPSASVAPETPVTTPSVPE
ncbi:MAG: hypothetical protein IKA08_02040 [Alphaproteobacteria bacterium]|nr:hypothetical protein [Alphaproteobacteria bacterium]